MTKYLGIISLIITLISMLIGGSLSYAKLLSKTERAEEKVLKIEDKVEELEKDSNQAEKSLLETNGKLDKNISEQNIKLEYIQKSVDVTNQGLKDLLLEIKKQI